MKKWAIIVLFLTSLIFLGVSKTDAHMMGGGMMGSEEAGERTWLGVFIQDITPELAKSLGLKDLEGVLISDVAEGGPAEAAGIKREDVIKRINGKEVKAVEDLLSVIREASPGDTVTIDLLRRGEGASIEVRLGSLKESMEEGMMSPEMGGEGMMEQGMPSPQAMGEMMGGMMGQMMERMMQGMMGGMMKGMMGGMGGMMGRMGEGGIRCPDFHGGMKDDYGRHGMGHHKKTFLTRTLIDRLKLTDEQIEKTRELEKNYRKESIRLHSDIEIAKIDLHDLLGKEDVPMSEIEEKVKEIEAKKTELHLNRIKAFNELKAILTKEQKDRLKSMGCLY